ncbi:MAG: TIGR02217 family protein [Alphaproteobacteria bacterium]|nr:MAG: TIGR02217 family protein [Alphaproteobacteria bacterium]
MDFHEIRLPTNLSYGMSGGARYRHTAVESASGHEQVFQEWDLAQRSWTIQMEYWDYDRFQELQNFWHGRAGGSIGFRFREWMDCSVGMKFGPNGLELLAPKQFATGNGAAKIFQLSKTYGDSAAMRVRPITKPVAGKVRIWVAGVEKLTGWTCDVATGIVTFTAAPANGATIAWAGEFDTPVRFVGERMDVSEAAMMAGAWQGIEIREILPDDL